MSLPWIKLYCEILEDPKMGKMSEFIFARCIKLFLMAGREGKEGLLPPVEDMLWTLRLDEAKLLQTLHELAEVGVAHQADDGCWWITNFSKRQVLSNGAERTRKYREKLKLKETEENVTVTSRVTSPISSSSSPLSLDSDSSEIKDLPPAAVAYSAYQNNNGRGRQAEKLYQQVTGQMSIPSLSQTQALTDLQTLVDHYGKNIERAVFEGKEIFGVWCNTAGKNGKAYSPVNTAWLGKWLEKIAPIPGDPHESSMQAILNKARKEQEAMQKR